MLPTGSARSESGARCGESHDGDGDGDEEEAGAREGRAGAMGRWAGAAPVFGCICEASTYDAYVACMPGT